MFTLTKLLTIAVMPPFSALLLWLAAMLLYRRCRKLSYFASFLGFSMLYIFSTPYFSKTLNDELIETHSLTLADYQTAQAIVVLGGGIRDGQELYAKLSTTGNQLERMRYAAYLHQETKLPILTTGSAANGTPEAQIMADEFARFFHIPTEWVEPKAKTTKENALFSREILEKAGIKRIILVSNQFHLKRAKMLFEQQGFEVLPAGVGAGKTPDEYLNYMYFVPQAGAIQASTLALKEWLGYWKEK